MSIFFDTHAHLDFPDFTTEVGEVVRRAHAAGIERIISIGTDFTSSRRAIELSEQYPGVFAAVGWHPGHASEAPEDVRPALRELARHPKVVAIGETGLDYYRLPEDADAAQTARLKRKQAALFAQQLEVGAELGLNCIIHQRDSMEDVLAQFEPFAGRLRAVFHCFVTDPSSMRRVLAMGCLVSFTGIVTFKNAAVVRETLAAVPPDQFMLETDSPYLAPVPYRGKRCEPAYVRETAAAVAQVRGVSLDELSMQTCATARRFFPRLT